MPLREISNDIRRYLIINTVNYNGDGKYGVFDVGFNELSQYGVDPNSKNFRLVNTEREVAPNDLEVGQIAESLDLDEAYVMRVA